MTRQQKTLVVTGAAGGVGAHVVQRAVAEGWRVRAVDIISAKDAFLANTPWYVAHADQIEWTRLDLSRTTHLAGVFEGANAVIHCAARVSLDEAPEVYTRANTDVTRAVWEAANEAGVAYVVALSCATFYAHDERLVDETSTVAPSNHYEASKLAAERILQEDAGAEAAWTILRPAHVYGPFCRTMGAGFVTLPPILRQFLSYLPGLTGGPRANWCHAEDVARAALFVVEHSEACAGEVFHVADEAPLAVGEVLTSMTEALGLEVGPNVPFPTLVTRGVLTPLIDNEPVFDMLRGILRQLWKRVQSTHLIDSPLRPRLDRRALLYTVSDAVVDASKLQQLGWSPRWPDLREGIVETVRWYQHAGWLPRYDTQAMLEVQDALNTRGFAFNEELDGVLRLAHGHTRSVQLDLDVSFGLADGWTTNLQGHIDGTIQLDRAEPRQVRGTLTVDWLGRGRTVYEFGYEGSDGRGYRFHGVKQLRWSRPVKSVERLDGVIWRDDGEEVGEASLTFDVGARIVPFLVSLRFLTRNRDEAA